MHNIQDLTVGSHGKPLQRTSHSGTTGNLDDDGEDNLSGPEIDNLETAITNNTSHNFNPEAVDVPEIASPFLTPADEQEFYAALAVLQNEQVIPAGYGLLPDEWDDHSYPTLEVLGSGRRGRREITVSLPEIIWRPRAELWGCAVDLLIRLLE